MEKSFTPNEYEIEVLRMLNGERELPWGSWVGACIEFLSEAGYVTKRPPYSITERGRAFLKTLDKPID